MPNPPVHHGSRPACSRDVQLAGVVEKGYGRLLPHLPPAYFRPDQLDAAADRMRLPARSVEAAGARWCDPPAPVDPAPAENPRMAAAYTYFGQFIDHDLTFDVASRLDRSASDPDFAPVNFRTPRFDLDSVYGRGPGVEPFLYGSDAASLRLSDAGTDLPRVDGATAIIPEPRNDENALVAQVHLAVMQLHNRFVAGGSSFDDAQRLTRWHYQWVVVHDFMRKVCGDVAYHDLMYGRGLALLPWPYGQFIPVEFSGAAYRFGHSQVRADYVVAAGQPARPLFGPEDGDLRGGRPVDADGRTADWSLMTDATVTPGFKIDTELVPALFALFGDGDEADDPPELPPGLGANLAARNLRRGVVLGLPSGEAVLGELVARGLLGLADYAPIGPDDVDDVEAAVRQVFWKDVPDAPASTPLWGWVLAEAEVVAGGEHLGPVGARLVGETIVGLLQADPRSLLRSAPGWAPSGPDYGLRELLTGA